MNQAIEIILKNKGKFPKFKYYISLIKTAKKNINSHPDICIETCKSLLEGVSKTIILELDDDAILKDLESRNMNVEKLVKRAAKHLRKLENVIEDDFIIRCGSFVHILGTLRNERGDISHGKSAPKSIESNRHLAKMIFQVTDGMLLYLLTEFFQVVESREADAVVEVVEPPPIRYEDNPRFNDSLDDGEVSARALISYSQAYYEFYKNDYLVDLAEWEEKERLIAEKVDKINLDHIDLGIIPNGEDSE